MLRKMDIEEDVRDINVLHVSISFNQQEENKR
jgi:hypothetical protein